MQQLLGPTSSSNRISFAVFVKSDSEQHEANSIQKEREDRARNQASSGDRSCGDSLSLTQNDESTASGVRFVRVGSVAELFLASNSTAVELLVVDAQKDPSLVQLLEKRAEQLVSNEVKHSHTVYQPRTSQGYPGPEEKEALLSKHKMLSMNMGGDSLKLPSPTWSAKWRYGKTDPAKRLHERRPIGNEMQRATVGVTSVRQQTLPTVSRENPCPATNEKPQIRNFVTVDYKSSRRSLRGSRSFREKRVQRHRITTEMSAIMSGFDQGRSKVLAKREGAEDTDDKKRGSDLKGESNKVCTEFTL